MPLVRLDRFALILFSLLLTLSVDAYADNTRVYWNFAYLHTKSDLVNVDGMDLRFNRFFKEDRDAQSYDDTVSDLDDVDSGFKITWGYSVNTHFDWEIGFADFGEMNGEYAAYEIVGTGWEAAEMTQEAKSEGFFGHVQWSPEIYENLEFMLRVGLLKWDVKVNSRFKSVNPDEVDSRRVANEAGYDEYYGTGILYNIGSLFGLRVDVNRYALAETEHDSIEVAAQFYF